MADQSFGFFGVTLQGTTQLKGPVKIRVSLQESQFLGFCSFFSFLAGQVLTKVQV
jgi:hypothetical protein